MISDEGQPAATDIQDNYEATVLDFLDREMATVQGAQKKNQQSEELDALVTDLLKQVITETDQPRSEDKPLFDEDEVFAGLPSGPQAASEGPGTDTSATAAKTGESITHHSPASTVAVRAKFEKTVAKSETSKSTPKMQASPAAVFGSAMVSKRKVPIKAVAAAGLVVIAAAFYYFFMDSPTKVQSSAGPQATAVEAVNLEMQSGTPSVKSVIPNTVKSAEPAVRSKNVAATNAKAGPNAVAQKQPTVGTAAAPISTPALTASAQQFVTPVPAKTQSEPGPAELPKAPAEAKSSAEQRAPVTLLSSPIATVIERPSPPPAAEHTPPVIPPVPERKPASQSQQANAVSENPVPRSQPAPPAPHVNTLVPAAPMLQTSPVYPDVALRTRTSGSVVLDLQIDDQGKVVKATPVSGPPMFYNAAATAAMKWRYKPASLGGVNVPSQSRVTMVFNFKK